MITNVEPEYPAEAKEQGLEGRVWLQVLVHADGSVTDPHIKRSSGHPELDSAALAVATQNEFKPAVQDNKPVDVWITYKVDFKL